VAAYTCVSLHVLACPGLRGNRRCRTHGPRESCWLRLSLLKAGHSCDVCMQDDNFSSIVKSVLWGRSVFNNIRKFLQVLYCCLPSIVPHVSCHYPTWHMPYHHVSCHYPTWHMPYHGCMDQLVFSFAGVTVTSCLHSSAHKMNPPRQCLTQALDSSQHWESLATSLAQFQYLGDTCFKCHNIIAAAVPADNQLCSAGGGSCGSRDQWGDPIECAPAIVGQPHHGCHGCFG